MWLQPRPRDTHGRETACAKNWRQGELRLSKDSMVGMFGVHTQPAPPRKSGIPCYLSVYAKESPLPFLNSSFFIGVCIPLPGFPDFLLLKVCI